MPVINPLRIVLPISQYIACNGTSISWYGGLPKYSLTIHLPGGVVEEFSGIEETWVTWLTNLASGTQLTFKVADSTGLTASTDFTAGGGTEWGSACPPDQVVVEEFPSLSVTNVHTGVINTASEPSTVASVASSTVTSVASSTVTSNSASFSADAPASSAGAPASSAGAPASSPGAPASSSVDAHTVPSALTNSPSQPAASSVPITTPVSTSETTAPTPTLAASILKSDAVLSSGAIAGIVIGVAVFVAILSVLVTFLLRKYKKRGNRRGMIQPYSSRPSASILGDSESQHNMMSGSSPPQPATELMQERPMSNSAVSFGAPVSLSGDRNVAGAMLPVEAETSSDIVQIAEDSLSSASHTPTVSYLNDQGAPRPPLPPPATQAPASRKTRRDRLPTSIPAVPVAISGSVEPRAVDADALLQGPLETAGEIRTAGIQRLSTGRKTRTRDPRYEMDAGVSLSGGRQDDGADEDEDEIMSSSGQTEVGTLPPPYESTLGQT